MKPFLFKAILWIFPGVIACFGLWFGLLFQDTGRDSLGLNRMRPTSCNAMVLGTSRSAQGVNPEILQEFAPETGTWLNFSFNLDDSPWNEVYVDAIFEKIECSIDTKQHSKFLIFADPWTLDELCGAGTKSWLSERWALPCKTSVLKYGWHKTNPLDVIGIGSGQDLLTVFASSVPRQLANFLAPSLKLYQRSGVQKNGWLPNKSNLTLTEASDAAQVKVNIYKSEKVIGNNWPFSDNADELTRLIDHLQDYLPSARIILIRPPVSDLMLQLEKAWFPQTNDWLIELSASKKIEFIDCNEHWTSKSTLDFTDGHHLSIAGANRFSQFLAEYLRNGI